MEKSHKVGLIGAKLGWGAQIPETELAPNVLKEYGLEKYLNIDGIDASWFDTVEPEESAANHDPKNYIENLKQIVAFDTKLADTVSNCISKHYFPVILGGDHACAMGTWPGVVRELNCAKKMGLIWIDAHMDAHTYESSDSKAIHGMPVAGFLGFGDSKLTDIAFKGASIDFSHIVLIGIRSFEPKEKAFLEEHGVRIYYMNEVKERGFKTVFDEALAIVNKGTEGFGISIDVDGFDCLQAPGVGSPEPDGLKKEEVIPALKGIAHHPKIRALEIAEFNPTRDPEHITLNLIHELLSSFFFQYNELGSQNEKRSRLHNSREPVWSL